MIDYYKNEQKIFAAKKLHLSANFVKIFIPNLFKNWVIFSEDSLTRHLSAKIDHFLWPKSIETQKTQRFQVSDGTKTSEIPNAY